MPTSREVDRARPPTAWRRRAERSAGSLARGARDGARERTRDAVGTWARARQPRRTDLAHARWGLTVGPTGTLHLDGVDLAELARREGTPLHLVSGRALDDNAGLALRSVRSGDGGVDIFYSYKTNPVPGVLRRLHGHGIGAEVISPYELWLALELGVPGERIIYNGPAKSDDSIRQAIRAGVLVINANSAPEVDRIAALAAAEGRVAPVGVRVSLAGTWGGQFGLDAASAELPAAVAAALGDPWLDLRGLHVHRGGTMRTVEEMTGHVSAVLGLCDDLHRRTGWHPAIVDVGGSLACPTVAPIPATTHRLNRAFGCDLLPPDADDCLTLAGSSALVARLAGDHFRAVGRPVPHLVQEPGRALTGNTQMLLTTVVDVKHDTELPHAVLDAGMNLADPVPHEYHQLFSVSAPGTPHQTGYRLTGPICTPADVLYNHWRLPPLAPGHVLAIMDAGAYFVPFATSFSFPRPPVLLHDGAEVSTLRRRESFADLVGNDVDLAERAAPR